MMLNKNIVLILTIGLAISFSSPAQALWLSGYDYRKEITIDHTKIGSDLSNFPLAVILSDTTNIIDGNDVKFTLADGSTKLDYEMESYATDDAAYWVNIPTVSSGTDTTFYMYYGKTGDMDESTTAVWDSNYQMVQHLEETSGTHYDSTTNTNNGTPYNGVTQNATGKIDGADEFDGTDDYVDVSSSQWINPSADATWELWFKPAYTFDASSLSEPMVIMSRRNSRPYLSFNTNGLLYWGLYDGSIIHNAISITNSFEADRWYHVVATWGSSGQNLYIDGVLEGSNPNTNPPVSGYADIYIGERADKAYAPFDGAIDEVRISDITRSEDWIEASYYSENDTLLTFGNEEVIPEPASLLLLGFGIIGITVFKRRLTKGG